MFRFIIIHYLCRTYPLTIFLLYRMLLQQPSTPPHTMVTLSIKLWYVTKWNETTTDGRCMKAIFMVLQIDTRKAWMEFLWLSFDSRLEYASYLTLHTITIINAGTAVLFVYLLSNTIINWCYIFGTIFDYKFRHDPLIKKERRTKFRERKKLGSDSQQIRTHNFFVSS